jgi:hypothetical protein
VVAQSDDKRQVGQAVSPPGGGYHRTLASPVTENRVKEEALEAERIEAHMPGPVMTPTRSSFLAKWKKVDGASGYRIDVSSSPLFDSYVDGYRDLDCGNITNRIITGLKAGTKYYYRVRADSAAGSGNNSETMSTSTANTTSGLVINPTFDSSITTSSLSNAIQRMIITAIQSYQSLFTDPITVSIYFRYSNLSPLGDPLDSAVAQSAYVVYHVSWASYISSLKADATTLNDASANASLPSTALSSNIIASGADGRAIGLNTPPAMFSNGVVRAGGPYDGIVTLNSSQPLQFARPIVLSNYDARTATEHEIDEILGLGSHLDRMTSDLRPQDLFGWSNYGLRNTSSSGSRYFSIDGGLRDIVDFNQDPNLDFGDWFSPVCPPPFLYVQYATGCRGVSPNISELSPEAVALDVIGYNLTMPAGPTNISTRVQVGTGNHVVIAGFIIGGTGPKQILLRALGPTLTQFNVTAALADPTLQLFDANGCPFWFNDNWKDTQQAQIQATGLAPPNDLESAILQILQPGNYTAVLSGKNDTTGVALVEVYDIATGATSHLSNISSRGFVQTDADVMIAGLIVQSSDKQVIVRVLGPALTNYGVADPLNDPSLELRNGNGALLAFNDNWRTSQEAEVTASGYAPPNDVEPAIVQTLAPGSYTAIVRGVHNSIGIALVESYTLY